MKKEKTLETKTERGILKTEFDKKHAATARFVAWLTNRIYYKTKDNTFRIIKHSELEKLAKEKLDSQNYMGYKEILASARKTFDTVVEDEMAQVYSKSIRVTTPTFLKVTKKAGKLGCTRSDIVRMVLAKGMQKTTEILSKQVPSKEKIAKIQGILNSWAGKDIQKSRKGKKGKPFKTERKGRGSTIDLSAIGENLIDFSLRQYTTPELSKEIKCWLEYDFIKGCVDSGIDKGFAEDIWHNSYWNSDWDLDVDLSISSSEDEWNFSLSEDENYMKILSLNDVDDPEMYTKLLMKANILAPMDIYLEDEGYRKWNMIDARVPPFEKMEDAEKFFEYCHANRGKNIGEILFHYDWLGLPGTGKIQIRKDRQKRVLFNGIAIDEEHKEKLINDILKQLLQAVGEEKLLKQDVKKLEQKSLDALSKNDLKTSSEIAEKLSFLNETKKLSALLASTLVSFVNSTQVITVAIPKPLATLLGATIEEMDLDNQLFEEV